MNWLLVMCRVRKESLSKFNLMKINYFKEFAGSGRFKLTAKAHPITRSNCECGWGIHSFVRLNTYRTFKGYTSLAGIKHTIKDEIICSGVISKNFIHDFVNLPN
jgi:hypothetical protein